VFDLESVEEVDRLRAVGGWGESKTRKSWKNRVVLSMCGQVEPAAMGRFGILEARCQGLGADSLPATPVVEVAEDLLRLLQGAFKSRQSSRAEARISNHQRPLRNISGLP
jgi:hypothetical protein